MNAEVFMILFFLRNVLVLIVGCWYISAFAQNQNTKRNWTEVGCSTKSLYVQTSPRTKKVFVSAKADCKTRARLLGFDRSVCDQCKPSRAKDGKPSPGKPPKDPPPGPGPDDVTTDPDDPSEDEDETKDDKKNGNNGHGNDKDHNDSSNPGKSNNGDNTDDDGSSGKGKDVSH